jgi:hypothetical protein
MIVLSPVGAASVRSRQAHAAPTELRILVGRFSDASSINNTVVGTSRSIAIHRHRGRPYEARLQRATVSMGPGTQGDGLGGLCPGLV